MSGIKALRRGLVLGLVFSAAAPALAEQPSANLCTDPSFGTPQIAACMEKAAAEADKRLNDAYRKAISIIEKDSDRTPEQKVAWRQALLVSERAWTAFRDADCGDLTVIEWNSGSGTGTAIAACRYDKTVQRTAELLARYPLR